MLARVKVPPTDIRITGEGAETVLRDLRRLYDDNLVVEEDEEYVDVEETQWYKKMRADMTPGKALRLYRQGSGLSLADLSEKSGVPKGHLSQMENGKRPIGRNMACRLSKVLGCDYRSLL
ncbi:MAG: helix-turn-helix transcriptional regulator [Candidatus Eremiobacteraeota bacterium]|nr:helix-turn-helix transcriptional regulator [Candidatus Eremiobacteraeota bacterium]